jgi:hypothetical protein
MTQEQRSHYRQAIHSLGVPYRHLYGESYHVYDFVENGASNPQEFGLVVYTCKLSGGDWWALWSVAEAEAFIHAWREAEEEAREYLSA